MSLGITVTFDGNGGGVPSPSSVLYTPPCAYGTLPVCAREGYHFLGWYTASSGGTKVLATDSVSDAGNYTLYAQWSAYVYRTVTFDANGGSVSPASGYYVATLPYGSLPTPTRSLYVFAGWWTGEEDTYPSCPVDADTVGPDEAHTLYAHWNEETESGTPVYWECTEDNEWVYVDVDVVAENLPSGLQEKYDSWLDDGARVARLQFIVDGVVQDFRKAVAADSHSVGSADPSLIPMPCHRAAQMMIWYFLAVDCGYSGAEALRNGWQDAEVYLRSLHAALRMGSNRFADSAGSGSGLPKYNAAGGSAAAAGGASFSGSGGAVPSYGGGTGYISLGL